MLKEMTDAYNTLKRAMTLCGWAHLYHKVTLRFNDIYEINFYAVDNPLNDYPLCRIIRGILFDQVPDLYQILK